MRFCAICGNYHDPDLPCLNETNRVLRDAGIYERRQKPGPGFQKTAKLADRFMLKVLIYVLSAIVLSAILAKVFGTRPW